MAKKKNDKKEINEEEVIDMNNISYSSQESEKEKLKEQERQPVQKDDNDWEKEFVLKCNKRIRNYLFHVWEMLDYYKQEEDESTEDIINALMSDIFEETEEIEHYCKIIFYGKENS